MLLAAAGVDAGTGVSAAAGLVTAATGFSAAAASGVFTADVRVASMYPPMTTSAFETRLILIGSCSGIPKMSAPITTRIRKMLKYKCIRHQ